MHFYGNTEPGWDLQVRVYLYSWFNRWCWPTIVADVSLHHGRWLWYIGRNYVPCDCKHKISSAVFCDDYLLFSCFEYICVLQGEFYTFCSAFYELCGSVSNPAHDSQQKRTWRLLWPPWELGGDDCEVRYKTQVFNPFSGPATLKCWRPFKRHLVCRVLKGHHGLQNNSERRATKISTNSGTKMLISLETVRNKNLSNLFHKPQVCSAERKKHAAHIAAGIKKATNSNAKSWKNKEGQSNIQNIFLHCRNA